MSRFNFEIDQPLRDRVRQWPSGIRSEVLRKLLLMAAEVQEKHGNAALGAILDNQFYLESRKLK